VRPFRGIIYLTPALTAQDSEIDCLTEAVTSVIGQLADGATQ
jgi:adenosylmethionine-8-amino-7-oxononanoate aminotransferase